jgi:hypothetical protein
MGCEPVDVRLGVVVAIADEGVSRHERRVVEEINESDQPTVPDVLTSSV